MSSDNTLLVEAINLSQFTTHPTAAIAALIKVVQRQEEQHSALEQSIKEQATQIESLLKIVEIYINPDLRLIDPCAEDISEAEATKKRARLSRQYGARLTDLEDRLTETWEWVEDLDCKIQHIKPKDIHPSISAQRSIDKILEALHKKETSTQYLTYKQIGKLLCVSAGRVCQLRTAIKSDGRLTISGHPNNDRERIVTLNPLWGRMA
jgi:predicted RNase H-like nuclease (RuvC/YqgF family)